jgi:amino acid adenylation domain-containing protein
MSTSHAALRCVLIGEGTLLIQCAELLRQAGHILSGITSPDPQVCAWATRQSIAILADIDALRNIAHQQPIDYLFSIVNSTILPADVLALPRRYAINYHDAPLPRYAGLHATSWALLQHEQRHGITWHLMSEMVDAGDIVTQRHFEIGPDETALTLNARCYDAAIDAFAELVDDISHDRVRPQPQNLAARTVFSLAQRPAAGCIISWRNEARDLDALVRALQFGPYPNPLGLPKLLVEHDLYAISELAVLETRADLPPGTVSFASPTALRVTTASHEVELRQLATLSGEPLSIADFTTRYGITAGYQFPELDPAAAERLTARNAQAAAHEAFWVRRLASLQPVTLPHARRTPSKTAPPGPLSVPLTPPTMQPLPTNTPKDDPAERLPLFFLAFLVRVSGAACLDVGFYDEHIAAHSDPEGFFAPHVPLRIKVDPTWSGAQVEQAIRQQIEGTRRHRTYGRDVVARYPALRERPELHTDAPLPLGLRCLPCTEEAHEPHALPGSTLTLDIAQSSGDIRWRYDPAHFEASSIDQIDEQFRVFCAAMLEHPEHRLADMPLISAAQQQRMLVEWNATQRDYPADACLHELFADQAARAPEAIAATFGEQHLSYGELDQQASALAQHIQAQGCGPDSIVALLAERSLDMLVGMLGILKAGAAYVPLDPAAPRERLAHILADTQAPLVVAQERLAAKLPEPAPPVALLDAPHTWRSAPASAPPAPTPDNLAYVIYTSGSTGTPKGILITHRGIVNHSTAIAQHYDLSAADRGLQFAPITFDVAGEEIFPLLLRGGTLVLRPEHVLAPFSTFLDFLRTERISVLNLPTSYWHAWVTELAEHEPPLPPDLRLVVVGTEHASPRQLARWRECVARQGHPMRWINAYGPTEATITATLYEPSGASDLGLHAVPIGRPIANMRAYILDHHHNPLPVGLPGELCLGGPGLARGYLNRPEITAAQFIADPFSSEPGARLYKTGDLVRYRDDGVIEFLRRIDQQVKIRGFRVEPGEIEAALQQHPAVHAAVIIPREDSTGNRSLVAYVEPVSPAAEDAALIDELRAALSQKLPAYMVPALFLLLPEMPLLPNGKIDRRALPVPTPAAPAPHSDYVAPRTPTEEMLASIWAEVLGLEHVGIHDNFFTLGGHSLHAMQLVSRVAATTQRKLPIKTLFEHPDIARLAAALAAETAPAAAPAAPATTPTAPQLAEGVELESRSLLARVASGSLPPLDSAALIYPERTVLGLDEAMHEWCEGLPLLSDIVHTSQGNIGIIMVPRYDVELYADQAELVRLIGQALTLAGTLGARTVSLTGLIPSATNYGRALLDASGPRPGSWPTISTGHATTTAAVVLNIRRMAHEGGRTLAHERVGYLGLGSVGTSSLRLMLHCLPHPREILLCDVYSKASALHALRHELIYDLGYKGAIRIIETETSVPPAFYDASLIVGATNVTDVLDVERLRPGTLVVDDSGPHCFPPDAAIARFQQRGDILLTEGGLLRAPELLRRTQYLPPAARHTLTEPQMAAFLRRHQPYALTGCILSSLLSARFAHLPPQLGLVDVEASASHYAALTQLGFQGADLHCEGYTLDPEIVAAFRRQFGGEHAPRPPHMLQ